MEGGGVLMEGKLVAHADGNYLGRVMKDNGDGTALVRIDPGGWTWTYATELLRVVG